MDELELHQGGIVRLTNFECYADDGVTRIKWKAPKGKVFICMLMGLEEKKITKEGDCLEILKVAKSIVNEESQEKIDGEISSVVGRMK